MAVTRRGFIKGAFTAAALALVPSLPGLPKVAQEGRKAGQAVSLPLVHSVKVWNRALSAREMLEQYDIQHVYLGRGSWQILDNFGILSESERQKLRENCCPFH